MLPVIAIVGRPNAGKSTLFNRLTRTQRALVDAEPGVTRDRNIAEVLYDERRFLLVDTGGFDAEATGDFAAEVREQSAVAIAEADAIVFVVDGRAGLAPGDRDVLDRLRRGGKPFWLAVNKLDTPALDDDAAEFFALGVERVLPISTAHGRGVGELMEQVLASLDREEENEEEGGADESVSVAIIGRPNVGKSSLMNRLVGFERAIVTPIPGTTRDAIDTPFTFNGKAYVLVDTAGIRRRPRVHERVERGSVTRSLRALERSEVGVLVVDAVEGMTDQDARIASYAWERGRALVIVVNKCDLAGGVRRVAKTMEAEVARLYPTLADVPVLCTSAVTGEQVQRILRLVERVAQNHRRELPTPSLNQVVTAATRATAPPSVRGKRPTFQYAVQTGKRPPRITIFCSAPQLVTEAYARYLVNRLREAFPLTGTPVRIGYRARREERPGRGRKR